MKNYKNIISLMSGTSVDSIDACLVRIFDDLSFNVIDSYSLKYSENIRKKILELANGAGSVADICYMNFVVGDLFARAVNLLIKKSGIKKEDIDFISSHGQTVCHLPQKQKIDNVCTGSTLQIGDISVISQKTGILTIGDFRPKDIASGGQGAPLVPFADRIIFPRGKNRLIQNIGGISNVTVLSDDVEIFAFDNGPGNMLIDYFMQKLFNQPYDKNGQIALKGNIDFNWLNKLLKEPYYKLDPPKSTGRELFNSDYAENIFLCAPASEYDVIATITYLTAKVIVQSYEDFIFPKTNIDEVVLGGGGAYNQAIIKYLKELLPSVLIKTHEDYFIPNKLKECIAFAYLGYFAFNKQTNNIHSCTGADENVIMGKFSY